MYKCLQKHQFSFFINCLITSQLSLFQMMAYWPWGQVFQLVSENNLLILCHSNVMNLSAFNSYHNLFCFSGSKLQSVYIVKLSNPVIIVGIIGLLETPLTVKRCSSTAQQTTMTSNVSTPLPKFSAKTWHHNLHESKIYCKDLVLNYIYISFT